MLSLNRFSKLKGKWKRPFIDSIQFWNGYNFAQGCAILKASQKTDFIHLSFHWFICLSHEKTGLSSKNDRKNTHFRKAVKFSFLSKICEWHDLTNLQSFKIEDWVPLFDNWFHPWQTCSLFSNEMNEWMNEWNEWLKWMRRMKWMKWKNWVKWKKEINEWNEWNEWN